MSSKSHIKLVAVPLGCKISSPDGVRGLYDLQHTWTKSHITKCLGCGGQARRQEEQPEYTPVGMKGKCTRDWAPTHLRFHLDTSTVEGIRPSQVKCNGNCCPLWMRPLSPHTMEVELHRWMLIKEKDDQMASVHASNIRTLDNDF